VSLNADRRMPWGTRYVRFAEVLASSAVHTVQVADRVLEVPRHGHLVVVWATRRPPAAVARAAEGEVVCAVPLTAR
jgi:hypothetical protein